MREQLDVVHAVLGVGTKLIGYAVSINLVDTVFVPFECSLKSQPKFYGIKTGGKDILDVHDEPKTTSFI